MGLLGKALRALRAGGWQLESRLFDWRRGVRTSGDVTLADAGISPAEAADSQRYVPARAANIRAALRAVSARLSEYTFVDLGSGKGRALFVAAEFPFRRIVGVERSGVLHRIASRNVAAFQRRSRTDAEIVSILCDVRAFPLPAGPLVLYLFNPFGTATMQSLLDHLAASLRERPRHVIVILVLPVYGHLVARVPGMRRVIATPQYEMLEAYPPPAEPR